MKEILGAYTKVNLVLRIVIGLVIGVILALLIPQVTAISILGNLFIGALKGIAPVLVFVLIASSLANAKTGHGSSMKRIVALYIIGTLAAAFLATVASFIFPVDMVLSSTVDTSDYAPPESIAEVFTALLTKLVANPIEAIASTNFLGVLFWSICTGIVLRNILGANGKRALKIASDTASTLVSGIIQCAPFGILGLIFTAVSENGMAIFVDYGKLLLLLVGCILVMALVINPIIVAITMRKNPYPLVLRCLRESAITAFFTRSSAANIPVNMNLCKSLDLDEDDYSISIPLGATIDMEGAAITISIMTLATVHTLGIPVDFLTAVLLSFLAALGACGASGVAGGSLLLIPMACSLFGVTPDIAMMVVGVGFTIGVIQDGAETALNSSTDVLFTAAADHAKKRKAAKLEAKCEASEA